MFHAGVHSLTAHSSTVAESEARVFSQSRIPVKTEPAQILARKEKEREREISNAVSYAFHTGERVYLESLQITLEKGYLHHHKTLLHLSYLAGWQKPLLHPPRRGRIGHSLALGKRGGRDEPFLPRGWKSVCNKRTDKFRENMFCEKVVHVFPNKSSIYHLITFFRIFKKIFCIKWLSFHLEF